MRKMVTRCIGLAVMSTFILGSVAGCGSSTSATGTDTTTEKTETSVSEAAPATEAVQSTEADYATDLPTDYSGTLTMWGWDDAYFKAVTEAFNKKYPNVKFEYTPMANGDTLQKYQTALASGTELPDVAWSIIDSRAKVYELDMWEDLSKAPYNFDISQVYDFLQPRMVNSKGQVCGIEQSLCPAGFAYRKDLAKKYLGTDDPKELEKMFPDWESFIKKGKEVYDQSNGKVFMMRGAADAQQFIREQDSKSWIDGTTIEVTDTLSRSIKLACEFRDNNVVDKLEAWSAPWYASFGQDNHIFAGCATWSSAYVIEPNDPNGESSGHWGLMGAPEGNINWGGTTLGITKTCKDKRLAWEFVKFATLSTEGAKALNSIGFFTSAKQPYIDDPSLKSYKSKWFGSQDIGEYFFDEIVPNIKPRKMNIDDNVIHESLNLITTSINNDKKMTSDQAIEKLKEELKTKLPDYTIK